MFREMSMWMRLMAFVFVLFAASTLTAQMPDGIPPANEGVCDDLKYATPGLYGLCVAFCEAQDCEPEPTADDPHSRCAPSSPKLLDIYNKKKRPGDPDMPCIREPCPCWLQDELNAFRFAEDDPASSVECWDDYSDPWGFAEHVTGWTILHPSGPPGDWPFYTHVKVYVNPKDGPLCEMYDLCRDSNCLNFYRHLTISPEQWATCEAQIRSSGADRLISCFVD